MTPTWFASSLDINEPLELSGEPLTVKDPVQYGWTMCRAQEVRRTYTTVGTGDGETATALTVETLVLNALLYVS